MLRIWMSLQPLRSGVVDLVSPATVTSVGGTHRSPIGPPQRCQPGQVILGMGFIRSITTTIIVVVIVVVLVVGVCV